MMEILGIVLFLGGQSAAAAAPLAIEGGYAEAKEPAPGASIHVWAHLDPNREVFLGWEGPAAEHLDERSSWHAVLTVPAGGLPEPRLRAVTERVELEPRALDFEGPARVKTMDYFSPAEGPARGLVFYCHDTGARRGALLKGDTRNVALTLAHRGYLVAAISSEEADADRPGEDGVLRWNGRETEVETSTDLQNLLAARAALIAAGALGEDAPCFAFGQGNGGTFAITAVAALGWRAAGSFCGPGYAEMILERRVPVFWVMAARDSEIRTATDTARATRKRMVEAEIPAQLHVFGPSPFRPERMIERCGMDERLAADVHATMKRTAALDAEDRVQMSSGYAAQRIEAEKLNYADLHVWYDENPARPSLLRMQLDIADGGHATPAEFAPRLLAFFEQHRGD